MKRPKHDFMASLKNCTKQKNLCKGAKLHGEMLKRGLLKRCVYLANALISMYVKCGALEKAKKVLEEIPSRNVVSWSALIWGYIQQGQSHDALNCFDLMQCEGISPDATTFTCILKACGALGEFLRLNELMMRSFVNVYWKIMLCLRDCFHWHICQM